MTRALFSTCFTSLWYSTEHNAHRDRHGDNALTAQLGLSRVTVHEECMNEEEEKISQLRGLVHVISSLTKKSIKGDAFCSRKSSRLKSAAVVVSNLRNVFIV